MTYADTSQVTSFVDNMEFYGGIILKGKWVHDAVTLWSMERAHSTPRRYWRVSPGGAVGAAVY